MNVQLILERLHQPRPTTPDVAALRRLHRAWRNHIPYENLDLQLGRAITIDPAYLVEKFGVRRRGGTCFQMNGTLSIVLRELGFTVSVVEGAVLRAKRGDVQWGNHISLLVDIDGERWLADVGIGDSFLEPLPLREGTHRQGNLDYRLEQLAYDTWRAHHHENGTISSWDFSTAPRELSEFADQAERSEPALRKVLVAQRHDFGQELALRSRVLSRQGHAGRQVLLSQQEFEDCLVRDFWIPLTDIGPKALRTLWEKTEAQYHEWMAMQAERASAG